MRSTLILLKEDKMNNISLKQLTLAVIATALISTYVSADDAVEKTTAIAKSTATHKIDFQQIDTDKDGAISQVEAKVNQFLNDSFAKVDTNGDAVISKDEFDAFVKKH